MPLRDHLQQALAANQLEAAIQTALRHLTADEQLRGQAIHFSARWTAWETQARQDAVSADQLRQEKNRLMADFIAFVEDLPEEIEYQTEVASAGEEKITSIKPKGIPEARFKWHVFLGLLVIKGGVLAFLFYSQSVHTLTTIQYNTLNGLMLPVFSAAFVLMAKHFIDQRHQTDLSTGPHVSRQVQWFTYLVLLAYLISLLLALRTFGTTDNDFNRLLGWVNNTEALLGAALGYVISTLFKATA